MRKMIAALSLVFSAYLTTTTVPPPETPAAHILGQQEMDSQWRAIQHTRKVEKAVQQAASVFKRVGCRRDYSALVGRYAVEEGLNPRIAAALIFVESSCNPLADDHRGSHGLTQVNVKTWKGLSIKQLEDPEINIRNGFHILSSYIRRYGVKEGLHAYNGFGITDDSYGERVLSSAGIL
jgi:Transglycosylase SLT domain